MKKPTILLIVLLTATTASIASEPVFRVENIFPLNGLHSHGSSIVQCPNGDLLACWFHGSGERTADDVLVQGARLKAGADAWSPLFVMADTPGFPDCNPCLYIDRQNRLWLFWIPVLAHRWECCELKYRRADTAEDYQGDGPPRWSWQDVIVLKPGDEFAQVLEQQFAELGIGEGTWAEYAPPYAKMLIEAAHDPYKRQTGWMTRLHPLALPTGRILLPLYSDGFNVSLVALSDDLGETWRASRPIVGSGPTQPSLVRKQDGTIVAYLRDSGDPPARVQVSTSADDGVSWTPTTDIDIPNPDSSLEVITLADGAWLMVCNDTEDNRNRLAALLSDDEGATWKWKRALEPFDGKPGSFGYPSVIQSSDGLLHATYSFHSDPGNCIRHCVFNIDWLKTSK